MPLKSIAAQIPRAINTAITKEDAAISVAPRRFLPARMPSAISPATPKAPTTPTEMRPVVKIGVQSCK